MKFVDDGDRFGIILTPVDGRHFYQFRLVVGGQVIGGAALRAIPVSGVSRA